MKSREAKLLAEAAHEAAVSEALTTPKPGLVDAEGSGCHNDMDCALFLKSARAIAPFWEAQARTGLEGTPPSAAMRELRAAGAAMERAMFAATDGINTHKGLIYLMSLLLYGAGYALSSRDRVSAADAAKAASLAVRGVVEKELLPLAEKRPARELSNGERLFVEYGITGIRGEAAAAFPSVIGGGLPAMRRAAEAGASENDAGLAALLTIMTVCEDSNVIHRAGYDYWKNVYPPLVGAALAAFDPCRPDYRLLRELEADFLPLRVSPGGAADLLSCTYFLNSLRKI